MRWAVDQTNSVIDVLNEIHAPAQFSETNFSGGASLAQRSSQRCIFGEVFKHKRPAKIISEREAVQELLQSDLSYSGEVSTTVRSYNRGLLSIPSAGNSAVELNEVLDDIGRETLEDPHRFMLLNREEIGELREKMPQSNIYMDPLLRDDLGLYAEFVHDLFVSGMVEFTDQPEGLVTPFCVAKKNGKLRLILDCRDTNKMFRPPPALALGTGSSWSRLSIPEGQTLYMAQSDIKDYFYSLRLPLSLRPLFSMPAIPSALLATWKVPEGLGGSLDRAGWIYPMLRVVPMGWNWAMWISQRVHQEQSMIGSGISADRVLVDGKSPPDLSNGQVVLLPYADNLNVVGTNKEAVQAAKDSAVARLRDKGFLVHEEMDACTVAQSLGFMVDGEVGRVTPVPDRLMRVELAFRWLARRPRVTGKAVERLLGHAVHFMMLRRELLSLMRNLYDFVSAHRDHRCRLWGQAAREAHWISVLLRVCSADLRKGWSSTVSASDASLSGIAVCNREYHLEHVTQIGQVRESWRFKGSNPTNRPRDVLNSLGDPFEDPETVFPLEVKRTDPFELDKNFSEIPADLMQADEWALSFAQRMSFPEHITLLEGRGIVAALRHKFRATRNFGKAHLHLNDNLGMVLATDKGRSSSMQILRVCRRIACLLIATSSTLCCRWIPSEANVADGGSRRWEHIRKGHTAASPKKSFGEKVESQRQTADKFNPDEHPWKAFKQGCHAKTGVSSGEEPKTCSAAKASSSHQARAGKEEKESGDRASLLASLQGADLSGTASSLLGSGSGLPQPISAVSHFCKTEQALSEVKDQLGQQLCNLSERFVLRRRRHRGSHKAFGCARRCKARLFPAGDPPPLSQMLARMETTGPRTNSSASTLGTGSSHRHSDDEVQTALRSSSHPVDVRCLPETRRSVGDEAGRCDEAQAATSLPCDQPPPFSKSGRIKNGTLRREHHAGFPDHSLDGTSAGQDIHRPEEHLPVSTGLSTTADGLGRSARSYRPQAAPCSPLSASPRRTFSRSAHAVSQPDGSEETRPLDFGCLSQEIRGPCAAVTGVPEVAKGSTKASHEFSISTHPRGPKIFLPDPNKDLKCWFVEIFSGTAHLSHAMQSAGFRCLAFDLEYNSFCDVLDPNVSTYIHHFLSSKNIALVWYGMPCQSWSRARRFDGGPPPLRDDSQYLMGVPGLPHQDKAKVTLGNSLLEWTTDSAKFCISLSIPFVIENPYSSRCWLTKQMTALVASGAVLHQTDYCQFGMPWRKSTGLLGFGTPWLDSACLQCCPKHGRCSRTHKRHIILSGKDSAGMWWTIRAQPYPPRMCHTIASMARALCVSG